MNFISFELDVDFENARKVIELQKWYLDFKQYTNKEIIKVLPKTVFSFKKFYKKDDGSVKGSITLNIENYDEAFNKSLKEIKLKTNKELQKLKIPTDNFGIKKTPDGYFAINLLRFFGEENELIGESYDLEKLMVEYTNKDFPKLEVRYPIVVISDQYLSNTNPQIIPENF